MKERLEKMEKKAMLISELDEWNRMEDLFRNTFGESSLGDRQFLKMKLKEYERLYHFYNGKTNLTKDEKAMLLMLRFQRRNLRKTLYPGLLTRMMYRTRSFLTLKANDLMAGAVGVAESNNRIAEQALPFSPAFGATEKAVEEQGNYQRYEPKNRYVRDIGKRTQPDNQQKQGRSL